MENLDKFRLFLGQDRGQKESTLRTNLKMVKKVLSSCDPLTPDTFRIYIQSLLHEKRSPSYIKQFVCIIRQWGECFTIPEFASYKYPKFNYSTDFVRATFEDEEIHAFLNAPNPHKTGVYANRYEMWIIFYTILFYHGLRTNEIARLRPEYIDFGRGVIMVPASISKTSQTRLVPLAPSMHEKIKEYVASVSGEYLFPSFHPSTLIPHVQCNDWRGFFNKQIARIGIKRKNLTAYSGRHTYGSRHAEEDVSVFKIKDLMGHKRIETTMKYIHIGLKSLKEVQDNDRLGIDMQIFDKRYMKFRGVVRKALEKYCKDPEEEMKMLEMLVRN